MPRLNTTLITTTLAFVGAFLTTPAFSADLGTPQGEIVLTVTGSIESTNQGDAAVFDLEMLEALPSETYKTTTIWTDDVQVLTGVPLFDFLESIGAEGSYITATAVNDYAIDIPINEMKSSRALMAYHNFGEPMSLRDKGPLWIVFPFDEGPEYQTEINYSRSIWQLSKIEVVK